MVRHIPNKYTQRLLLKEINVNNQGKYDFFYLPIDYQNSANVGYAFVNFVHHHFILDFFNEFHNRKWTNFNSKKRCEIKYGRLQGLEELKRHFQSSSVMNQTVSILFFNQGIGWKLQTQNFWAAQQDGLDNRAEED